MEARGCKQPSPHLSGQCLRHLGLLEAQFGMEQMQSWKVGGGVPPLGADVVQQLSHVRLFATPWTAARQAHLSFTVSQSLLRFISIESLIPSIHLILCYPPLAFSLSQHQGHFR